MHKSQSMDFHAQTQGILDQVQVLVDQIKNLDAPLGKEFLETKLGLKDFFKGKSGAVKRALEQHEATQIEKLIKLRNRVYPKGVLQERIETLMQYEVMMREPILKDVLAQIKPLSGQLSISAY